MGERDRVLMVNDPATPETPHTADKASEGLSKRIGKAIGWNLAASLIRLLMQSVTLLALARLISPVDFGLFCQGLLVVGAANILAHAGIGSALVQRENLTQDQIAAAPLVCLLLGLAVTFGIWVSAPAIAALLGSPDCVPILRAMSPLVLLNGIGMTPISLDQRDLQFKAISVIESVTYAIGYSLTGTGLAWLGCGVWALVFAAVLHEGLRAAWVHARSRLRFTSPKQPEDLREVASFCAITSVTGATLFIGKNLDGLIISRLLGAELLGFYNRAFQLVKMPVSQVARVTNSVLFSAFSRLQGAGEPYRRAYYQSLRLLTLLVFPASATLAVLSDDVVDVLLGEAWAPSASPLSLLCFCGFFLTACDIADRVILASGATAARCQTHLLLNVVMGISVTVGVAGGLVGATAGVLLATVLQYLTTARLALRLIGGNWSAFFASQTLGATAAALSAAAAVFLSQLKVLGLPTAAVLALSGMACCLATGVVLLAKAQESLPPQVAAPLHVLRGRLLEALGFQPSTPVTPQARNPTGEATPLQSIGVGAFGGKNYTPLSLLTNAAQTGSESANDIPSSIPIPMDSVANDARPLSEQHATRVLQVFSRMDAGGAETRILEIMKRLQGRGFQVDFCTLTESAGSLDQRILDMGGRIHRLPLDLTFPLRFIRLLKQETYDVLHTHAFHASGVFLAMGKLAGTPVRVAHYQSIGDGRVSTPVRRLKRSIFKRLVQVSANRVLGVCEASLQAAWRSDWRSDPRCRVIYSGIDTSEWPEHADSESTKSELGIPLDRRLLIHVGNFGPAKNHVRLLRIFAAMSPRESWHLLMVGHDPTAIRKPLEKLAGELGISDRITFAGRRTDVARLLMAADAMVFPSRREGLPGAVLEACATGMPVLATDLPGIEEAAAYLPSLDMMSLEETDSAWATAAARLADRFQTPEARSRASQAFKRSPFSLAAAVEAHRETWTGSGTPLPSISEAA